MTKTSKPSTDWGTVMVRVAEDWAKMCVENDEAMGRRDRVPAEEQVFHLEDIRRMVLDAEDDMAKLDKAAATVAESVVDERTHAERVAERAEILLAETRDELARGLMAVGDSYRNNRHRTSDGLQRLALLAERVRVLEEVLGR